MGGQTACEPNKINGLWEEESKLIKEFICDCLHFGVLIESGVVGWGIQAAPNTQEI